MKFPIRASTVLALGLCSAALAACTTATQTRGYVFDEELAESIAPGVDNRLSVQDLMGSPSLKSNYGDEVWYYVSRETVTRGFIRERPLTQMVLQVHFDDGGTVEEINRYTMADAVDINPRDAKTPIRGKTLGFFEQLFSGIGRVGPGGPAGPGGAGRPPGT